LINYAGAKVMVGALLLLLTGCSLDKLYDEAERVELLKRKEIIQANLVYAKAGERYTYDHQRALTQGEAIPPAFARAILEDELHGTACGAQTHIEIKLTSPAHTGENALLMDNTFMATGVFKAQDITDSSAHLIETGLEGKFDLMTGFLRLQSTPKPIQLSNEEEQEAERIRWEATSELRAVKRQLKPTMKNILSGRGQAETDAIAAREKELQAREDLRLKTLQEVAARKMQAAKAALIQFSIDIARDPEGKGWSGSLDGPNFHECDLMLASTNGLTTVKLPAPTSRHALTSQSLNYSKTPVAQAWIRIAAKEANEEDFLFLGRFFEDRGLLSPDNYERAFQYYLSVANKGNIFGQAALAHMYEEGKGTPKKPGEAERLRSLVNEVKKTALAVCEAPQTVEATDRLMEKARERGRVGELASSMFSGVRQDLQKSRVVNRSATGIVSRDAPFTCKIESERINPKVDAGLVPDYYDGYDRHDNYIYRDNSLEKFALSIMAGVAENMAKNTLVVHLIQVTPLGQSRYELMQKDSYGQATEIVDLKFLQ